MSGIEISDEITQSQLEALAGGELLKAEVQSPTHTHTHTHTHIHTRHYSRELISLKFATRKSRLIV